MSPLNSIVVPRDLSEHPTISDWGFLLCSFDDAYVPRMLRVWC